MQSAKTHLRWILAMAALLWLIVIGINGTAFFVIAAPENQRILQNNVGWERTYKPMIHDRLRPEVAVFGASWARDAFDYEEITELLGRPFFNHAVSGGQPYENRRFLQSALAEGNLQVVLLNLNSFQRHPKQLKFQYGFNEGLLNVDPIDRANPESTWNRFFAATLSGAAVGNNISALSILQKFRSGKPKHELLRAYDRHDFSGNPARLNQWQQMMQGKPSGEGEPEPFDATAFPATVSELAESIRRACAQGLPVKTYFTPSHPIILKKVFDQTALKLAMWDFLHPLKAACPKGLSYWDFSYPNAMTLEGLSAGGPSRYFREDGHPRPTAGQVMASQMFGKSFFPNALRDLGTDLLALDRGQAELWISSREARWRGQWQSTDRAAVQADLITTAQHGAP